MKRVLISSAVIFALTACGSDEESTNIVEPTAEVIMPTVEVIKPLEEVIPIEEIVIVEPEPIVIVPVTPIEPIVVIEPTELEITEPLEPMIIEPVVAVIIKPELIIEPDEVIITTPEIIEPAVEGISISHESIISNGNIIERKTTTETKFIDDGVLLIVTVDETVNGINTVTVTKTLNGEPYIVPIDPILYEVEKRWAIPVEDSHAVCAMDNFTCTYEDEVFKMVDTQIPWNSGANKDRLYLEYIVSQAKLDAHNLLPEAHYFSQELIGHSLESEKAYVYFETCNHRLQDCRFHQSRVFNTKVKATDNGFHLTDELHNVDNTELPTVDMFFHQTNGIAVLISLKEVNQLYGSVHNSGELSDPTFEAEKLQAIYNVFKHVYGYASTDIRVNN